MVEPILEALTFDLESDLTVAAIVCEAESSAGPGNSLVSCKQTSSPVKYSARRVLFNSLCLTPCLFPGCPLISPAPLINDRGRKQYDVFFDHLKSQHSFIILQPDSIANLHKYVLHWKERFSDYPINDFCTNWKSTVENDQESMMSHENDCSTFITIRPELEEEKQLRNRLWTERLEAVLEVSRYERDQTDLTIQCLFCREICTGNRSNLLKHMYENHSFHMGKPDNIVFIQELVQFLCETMASLKCMFCEKNFRERTILREHMRKKQHKQINPKNPDYDIYYLVNYLEPGKTWEALDLEDGFDERREEEWMEHSEENISIVCLFCSVQAGNFDTLLSHMQVLHKFDFEKTTQHKNFYEKVKIVNFIRRNMHQTTCLYCDMKFMDRSSLLDHIQSHHETHSEFPSQKVWNRPEHFFPTYENDQFLILLGKDDCLNEDTLLINCEEIDENVIPEDPPAVTCSFLGHN